MYFQNTLDRVAEVGRDCNCVSNIYSRSKAYPGSIISLCRKVACTRCETAFIRLMDMSFMKSGYVCQVRFTPVLEDHIKDAPVCSTGRGFVRIHNLLLVRLSMRGL